VDRKHEAEHENKRQNTEKAKGFAGRIAVLQWFRNRGGLLK
jgi:hypothetical protein